MGVNHKQRGYALAVIDRKLIGQRRLDARNFACDPARRLKDLMRLIDALKRLPDLDPNEAEHLRARLNVPQGMQHRRVLSLDERELLCADRATGMTFAALGEKYGVSLATAHTIARWVEITPLPGKQAPAKERKAPAMTTRKADSVALAKRCEDVGWETENTMKGIKVRTPNGGSYTIHLSYSDRRSLNNATADLARLGLDEAEGRLVAERSGERARRLAEDRRANDERVKALEATKTQRERDMLLRAAGPYLGEPEDVPLSWFTEQHPAPWMRWVWMTPAIARYLLEHHNKPGGAGEIGTNRPQSEVTIREYRDIIVSGQWLLTHQGMASDVTGMVQDGQHRMAALLAALELIPDLRLPVAYFVGMPVENFKAIDEGKLRTATQLFAMGGEKNGATIRAALRLIIAYKEGDDGARNRWRLRNTNAQLLDAFARDPQTLRTAASVANAHLYSRSRPERIPMGTGAYAALQTLLYTANGADNRFVEAFLHGIIHGTKPSTRTLLDDDDPRAALRRTLQSFKDKKEGRSAQGMDQLGLGILAWDYLVQGVNRRTLRWLKGTEIPQVLICKDTPGAIPPRALLGEVDVATPDDLDNDDEQ